MLERQILELDLDPLDAEPIRERCVDLHRLVRDPLLLLGRQVMQRAHVVEPIAQLDEDDTDVARHREQHLAKVFGLLLLARRVRSLPSLVTPSTRNAISLPNSWSSCSIVALVSSTQSCRRPRTPTRRRA